MTRFYWPGMRGDIRRWCTACPECQTVTPAETPKAPVHPLPLIEVPFEKINVDLMGPTRGESAEGYRFVLVIVDCASLYPEAVPLRNVSAKIIADALLQVFSRMGLPKEMFNNPHTSFISHILSDLCKKLGITFNRTSMNYTQTTVKFALGRVMREHLGNWDKLVEPLLFSIRELPQIFTGFSPFELLYRRRPRSILDLLKETWEEIPSSSQNEVQSVLELRATLHSLREVPQERLLQAQERLRSKKGPQLRIFQPGDKVLVLLPMSACKLPAKWQGPFEVTRRVGDVDYEVIRSDRGGVRQTYHHNMVKLWTVGDPVSFAVLEIVQDELGPEAPNDITSLAVPDDSHLRPGATGSGGTVELGPEAPNGITSLTVPDDSHLMPGATGSGGTVELGPEAPNGITSLTVPVDSHLMPGATGSGGTVELGPEAPNGITSLTVPVDSHLMPGTTGSGGTVAAGFL
ncbi:hypothetical protein AAFF_G00031660 [Aldrovandia affinis]|uniref:Gypsy retrotransposon integrase-like protein 1 n=1 Tax=Aldrovandia affinis TaxID=143900 RepID=A0AAD7S3R0_9TELE|nr:hypothetical protein AAFF_G00031660 [Aldrovandia affinis]